MAALIPNYGLLDDANHVQGILNANTVRLFDSNHTPAPGDSLATYTAIEASYLGYAAQAPSFGAPAINGSNQAQFDTSSTLVFGSTGGGPGNDIYGYWIDDGTGVYVAEKFAGGPFDMGIVGAQISLDITFLVESV